MSASLWSGLAPAARFAHLVERAGGERIAQRWRAPVHGDDAVADHDAVALLAVGDIACEFHRRLVLMQPDGTNRSSTRGALAITPCSAR